MQPAPAKLLCLLGSPRRNGNTDILAAEACRGYESQGGESQKIILSNLDLHPCTGCNACQRDRPEPCVLKDDMRTLYREMLEASALLWASPVYSWAPTVEMKIVLDRQYAWGDYQTTRHAAALSGRPVGFAVCYADPDPATNGFYHMYNIMKAVTESSGGTLAGCVHGAASGKGEISKQDDVLQKARELGTQLFHMSS